MKPLARRTFIALALQCLALVLLALSVAGRPWPDERQAATVHVLSDRSPSVAARPADAALQDVLATVGESPRRVAARVVEFGGHAADAAAPATNIEAAIGESMRRRTADSADAIVVLSDGRATKGDTERALRRANEAGVPVLWRTLPSEAATPRIVDVLAPARAMPGQVIPVALRLAGASREPLTVSLSARGTDGIDPAAVEIAPGALGNEVLRLRARSPGTLLLDAELRDAKSGSVVDRWPAVAVVNVDAPAGILYVADGPRPLERSLAEGGWNVTRIEPSRLDSLAPGLASQAAVILDDVPARAARPSTWTALAAAVREQGTGLLVLGGPQSFAAGSYRDSPLEPLLPVRSRPSGLGDSAAVVFVVDKSGSMGETSAGVDRFRLAQRAVAETAGTLGERDTAALVVFDAEPRVLRPMQRAGEFREAVAQPWPAQPRGGTRLAPALDAALGQLAESTGRRRILVLVTDGFVDSGPPESLRSRLAGEDVEVVVLGVGPDADTAALQPFFPVEQATILHVAEAAELPSVMRSGLESRRAPIERGRIAVRELVPLPFLKSTQDGWPSIAAYAVTTAASNAAVHLESERGDPVVAHWQAGLGHVAVVTSGLGEWTPEWLRSPAWPELAGGLAEWISARDSAEGPWASVEDTPDRLRVYVDLARGGRWSDSSDGRLQVTHPSGRTSEVRLAPAAPGRLAAEIAGAEDGLYSMIAEVNGRAVNVTHLRRQRREFGGADPGEEIAAWQAAGLVREWSPAEFDAAVGGLRAVERRPQRAILLALALFVLGVFVERGRGR